MNMKRYSGAVARRLNLPKDVKRRVMTDFNTTITAMQEAGRTDEEICAELGAPKKVAAELNERMKEFAYRKSPWRFAFLIPAILSGLWLVASQVVLQLAEVVFSLGESASIGIIGGADGPTAIFVATSTTGFDWDLLVVTAVLIGCVVGYLRLCRCKPKQ